MEAEFRMHVRIKLPICHTSLETADQYKNTLQVTICHDSVITILLNGSVWKSRAGNPVYSHSNHSKVLRCRKYVSMVLSPFSVTGTTAGGI